MKLASFLAGIGLAFGLLLLAPSATRAEGNSYPSCSENMVVGCVLTTLDGVQVHWNGNYPGQTWDLTRYGYEWQCVELIQRYYAQIYGYQGMWVPPFTKYAMTAAYQAFDDGYHPDSMAAYGNGGRVPPQKGDVLVFDATWDNPYGHVALVKSVQNGTVTFVEQNYYIGGEDSLPIDSNNNIDSQGRYGEIRGWLRDRSANLPPPPPVHAVPVAQAPVPPPAPPPAPARALSAVEAQALEGPQDETPPVTGPRFQVVVGPDGVANVRGLQN